MDQKHLSEVLKKTFVQRQILGDYKGAYSMGITLNPNDKKQLAISLRIESEELGSFPSSVYVGKEAVPVVVNGRFVPPSAARHPRSWYRVRTRRTPRVTARRTPQA